MWPARYQVHLQQPELPLWNRLLSRGEVRRRRQGHSRQVRQADLLDRRRYGSSRRCEVRQGRRFWHCFWHRFWHRNWRYHCYFKREQQRGLVHKRLRQR
jgi:hypothetical protein